MVTQQLVEVTISVQDDSRIQDAIELLPSRVPKAVEAALAITGPRLLELLRTATPLGETGELRAGWTMTDLDMGILFLNDVEHAQWVMEGTGIFGPTGQSIKPVSRKFMKFEGISGETVFAREVKGMQGRDFITNAFDPEEAANELGDLIIQGLLGDIEG